MKELTKNRIAEKTYILLQQKPITKITMVEIAKACGVSKPTLYHHFRDKFEIAQYITIYLIEKYYGAHFSNYVVLHDYDDLHIALADRETFFRNVLCYIGQNSIYDAMAERLLEWYLAAIKRARGTDVVTTEEMAALEYYCYSVFHVFYSMLTGKIPHRYQEITKPAASIYWPPALREALGWNKKNKDTVKE